MLNLIKSLKMLGGYSLTSKHLRVEIVTYKGKLSNVSLRQIDTIKAEQSRLKFQCSLECNHVNPI